MATLHTLCNFTLTSKVFKMNKFSILAALGLLLLFAPVNSAQAQFEEKKNTAEPEPKVKIPISGGERFDLILRRTFQIPTGISSRDSFPWDPARSGGLSMGMSFNFPIGSVFAIKLEPRATWQKMTFQNSTLKTFPTANSDSTTVYTWEKMRGFYVEAPVGFRFNLVRNQDEKVKLWTEIGGVIGYNLGGAYKRRLLDDDGRVAQTEKFHQFSGYESLRYGPYFRFSTNWIGIEGFYRLSDLFSSDETFQLSGAAKSYPKVSPLEIGVFIAL